MPNTFLHRKDGYNVYEFECPGCGVIGELGIPVKQTKLVFHECGVIFIQRPGDGSLYRPPQLIEVNTKEAPHA